MKLLIIIVLAAFMLVIPSISYTKNCYMLNYSNSTDMSLNAAKTDIGIFYDIANSYKKPISVLSVAYNNPCPGALTCMTYTCGGTDRNPYVCCPIGAPYLNNCDCKCYTNSNFNCMSYTYCRQY